MAKGKSKGRNNSGGGGTATIIGTNDTDTINFINKQVKDLGITGNVIVEYKTPTSDQYFAGVQGYVKSDNTISIQKEEGKNNVIVKNASNKLYVMNVAQGNYQKSTIAHELTHIKQMQKKELQERYITKEQGGYKKEYGLGEWVKHWKGKPVISETEYAALLNKINNGKTEKIRDAAYKKYTQLPWEKEAYAAGNKYN